MTTETDTVSAGNSMSSTATWTEAFTQQDILYTRTSPKPSPHYRSRQVHAGSQQPESEPAPSHPEVRVFAVFVLFAVVFFVQPQVTNISQVAARETAAGAGSSTQPFMEEYVKPKT